MLAADIKLSLCDEHDEYFLAVAAVGVIHIYSFLQKSIISFGQSQLFNVSIKLIFMPLYLQYALLWDRYWCYINGHDKVNILNQNCFKWNSAMRTRMYVARVIARGNPNLLKLSFLIRYQGLHKAHFPGVCIIWLMTSCGLYGILVRQTHIIHMHICLETCGWENPKPLHHHPSLYQ